MRENLWHRVSEMVGYFNSELSAPQDGRNPQESRGGLDCTMGPLLGNNPTSGDDPSSVKRLVCSPDLPVFSLTQAFEEAAAVESSAAAAAAVNVATTTPLSAPSPAPSPASDKPYECTFCPKTFTQKNTFQNHVRSHGKEGEDPYQCNICGKTFAVPARLTRHYRTHTGEKPYQCEFCSKSFSVKENLSVHRRIHTKERPYKCDVCDRAFEHSGKLHRHMRIHTGERPHKCAVCAKTFIQSGQLVIHMRTHTGEKPYVCKVCSKGFTCSKQLKVHTRTHTGEKPYTCDICGKSFGYNHVLKLHQVAHFGEKVYKCTICQKTFNSKKTMEVHIKSHSDPTTSRGGESSCGSSGSDKENKADSDTEHPPPPSRPSCFPEERSVSPPVTYEPEPERLPQQPHPNMRELCQYLYPNSGGGSFYQQSFRPSVGVNPALLEAVAVAAASEGRDLSPIPSMSDQDEEDYPCEPQHREYVLDESHSPMSVEVLSVTEPSVYLIPEPLASMQRHTPPPYGFQLPPPDFLEEPQPTAMLVRFPPTRRTVREDHRRSPSPPIVTVEPILTPPSSNPVSPVPLELAAVGREVLSLPPRKRSKMILKSMESEMVSVRYSSVIHYAKAS
uniref:C2H2-type domain-containing protein n=1 Tax=Timema shepardi TaxID=629360 RepID=A0A7R9FZ36_TIMSH|nr:unnamed protein product [Timema shepardi]